MTAMSLAMRRMLEHDIEEASVNWPLASPTAHSRGRVACPECGAAGWPKGSWTHRHLDHVACDCGLNVTVRGLAIHLKRHRNHRSP